jgi:YfiH family protein
MVDMLPQPSDGFAWVQAPAGPALVCRALEPLARHVFTTRPWTLGSSATGNREAGWGEVAAAADLPLDRLVRLQQVHGAEVRLASEGGGVPADILINDDRGLAIAVQAADCVPLLVADPRTGSVAAIHAGWRGMVARAPQRGVAALARRFGCRPVDLVAAIGPSIGACCYEVGADVRDAFSRAGFAPGRLDEWFSSAARPSARNPSMPGLPAAPRAGHWFFDGWSAVVHQLEEAGVPAAQIHLSALCTASHPLELCSYRRDGASAGRLAGVIRPRS